MTSSFDARTTVLLVETTTVQTLGTMAVLTIPAIAPRVAEAVGISASYIGSQISLLYLAAMGSSLVAGTVVAVLGAWRTSQAAMLLTAAGSALASVPHLSALVAGSLVIGAAYGLLNPAASSLLIRQAPVRRRSLIFAIKQTGVPLGGVAAGLIGPPLAIAWGWHAPLWVVSAASLLVAFASEPMRSMWDADQPRTAASLRGAVEGLSLLGRMPTLIWLSLASFCFSAIQLSFVGFLVVLLVEEVKLDLVSAGIILAAAQVFGAIGRVAWGMLADFLKNGLVVLLGLALVMGAASFAVIGLSPTSPTSLVTVIFMVLGASAVGWNGVYLSEIARLSPLQAVGSMTGAAMFVTYTGVVIGPTLFAILHGLLGSYAYSYTVLAALAGAGAALIIMAIRQSNR